MLLLFSLAHPAQPLVLSWAEALLIPIYALGLIALAAYLQQRFAPAHQLKRWLIPGLAVHLLATLVYGQVYLHWGAETHGSGGDSVDLYWGQQRLIDTLQGQPDKLAEILFGNKPLANSNYNASTYQLRSFTNPFSYALVKLTLPLYFICFGSWYLISLCLSAFAFSGTWALASCMGRTLPRMGSEWNISWFFLPSVCFWSSALLKEALVLGAFGWFVYLLEGFLFQRNYAWYRFLWLLPILWVAYSVRPFVFYAVLPCLLLWALFKLWFEKRVSYWQLAGLALVIVALLTFSKFNLGYVINEAMDQREDFFALFAHKQISAESVRQKLFHLPFEDRNILHIIADAPLAIFTALFRPLLWQASGKYQLLASLENMALVAVFLYLVLKTKWTVAWKAVRGKPVILFLFIFSATYLFFTALATPDFGTLNRYRIFALPFALAGWVALQVCSQAIFVSSQLPNRQANMAGL